MKYKSSYRKYRPNKFDDVIGQQHITTTLKNAIEFDKIAHAYLFNGPRGTGKTSIAKIFAKKINCECSDDSCDACKIENEDTVSDIIEMDAASNNSVDEIRKIVESVTYTPMRFKYKVYIIDEVHMLSKSAFNALLKTLEEPPKHVKFILATTEINKIPLTIISRCQRFDFKKIQADDIVERLEMVVNIEKIEYEKDALIKIAKLSDGAMRDAFSLLDKVIMYEKVLSLENVNKSFNLINDEDNLKLFDYLYEGKSNKVISYFKQLCEMGIDELKFVIDFQFFIRDILIEVVNLDNLKYRQIVLIEMIKSLNELESRLIYTKNYKLLIEVFLLEICNINSSKQYELEKEKSTKDDSKIDLIINEHKNNSEQIVYETHIEQFDEHFEENNLDNNELNINYKNIKPVNVKVENSNDESINVKVKNVDSTNIKVSNLIILDILKNATVNEKKKIINIYPQLKQKLIDEQKHGLSKFFSETEVCAASNEGFVILGDKLYIDAYSKRKNEIEHVISEFMNSEKVIFLIIKSEWETKRLEFVNQLKTYDKKKGIYDHACSIFGEQIVTKI